MENQKHFTENDIRPKDLKIGQQKAIDRDIASLLSKKNGFVEVKCPACGANNKNIKFEKNGFTYTNCNTCGTFYMNPRPTPKILENFLENSENYVYWVKYIFPASEKVRREKIFTPRVDRIIELCKKHKVLTSSILEVGAGFGTFCEEMKSREMFSRVVAVEPSPEWAKICREKRIETIESPIEDVRFEESNKFDVIVSFEVIEHLFDPEKFVASCRRLLNPGGLLVMTCPNGKGFDFLVLGKDCNSLDHEHLNYFNTASLAILMKKSGLEILEVITPGRLDADLVRSKILDGEFDTSNNPFLQAVLINEWEELGEKFQDFLSENNLSSNMWIVAKNPS